jgi:ethanolamine permease
VHDKPFIVLTIISLAWLNYRGVFATLTFNLVITAIACFAIVVLFAAVRPWTDDILKPQELLTGLHYGWLGVIAALHFGLWFYLGIEGTTQAAEEVRSPARALPLGTMTGMITLLVAATMTWYVCVGLMPWEYLGQAITPLFDAARLTGSLWLMVFLFIGTIFSTLASANGCINDASRAWFSMGRDRYLPVWFGAVHPAYRTPFRSIVFLVPVALIFALGAPLDQVITFSILSGLLGYTFMSFNMIMFRDKWPLGSIKRGYVHPFHPLPAIVLFLLCAVTYFAVFLGYGTQLVAMMVFYIVASAWFAFHRYKYVKRGDQFTMAWPRPAGY